MCENKILTVKELMEFLNISQPTAYRLVHSDEFFPAFRIGKKILINKDKLDRWLFDQRISKDVDE